MNRRAIPPRISAEALFTDDLCRLYRVLDNLEETANMALHYVTRGGERGRAAKYVEELQEYLAEERCNIVSDLRERPNTADEEGEKRLSILLQYEAWCREFHKSTLADLVGHPLSTNAV